VGKRHFIGLGRNFQFILTIILIGIGRGIKGKEKVKEGPLIF